MTDKAKMRILWHSNAPWAPTGYGNQTGVFTPKLTREHHVTISAFWGLMGRPANWEGMTVLPGSMDAYGGDILDGHVMHQQSDVLLTLMDVWVLPRDKMASLPWAAWVPIDHHPVPENVLDMLRVCRWPIAMSQYGLTLLEEAGLRAFYVPHGVDTQGTFYPVERAEARRKFAGYVHEQHGRDDLVDDETFVFAMVAANKGNPSRKSFVETLTAYKLFRQTYPARKTHLYLHTDRYGQIGVELLRVIDNLGLPAESVSFPPTYHYAIGAINPEYLNGVYNAADVLLNPAQGEGFGIPIIEAQAAGCPVIVGDNTAMKELCLAGWTVTGMPWYTPMHAWQYIPLVPELVGRMDMAWRTLGPEADKAGRDEMRQRARDKALAYDAETVYERYWRPVLAMIQAEIGETRETVQAVQAILEEGTDGQQADAGCGDSGTGAADETVQQVQPCPTGDLV